MLGKKETGDYQTPLYFTEKICSYLKDNLEIKPDCILEPTCGKGNFLKSGLIFSPKVAVGIEINPTYCEETKSNFSTEDNVQIFNESIFNYETKKYFKDCNSLLILGNPPWVTNTDLSSIGSVNIPKKSNIKSLKGFDALTGASNFDICEYIILQLIEEYKNTNTYFSLICKNSVSRNIYVELLKRNISFDFFENLEIDAKKIFNISASAGILTFKLSSEKNKKNLFNTKNFDTPNFVIEQYSYENDKFSCISKNTQDFDGSCCFEWRQGVKHDCSKIMELNYENGKYKNLKDEILDIETDLIFPLVKSSMFKSSVKNSFAKYVIIPQKKVNQDTSYIKLQYPKTWKYLSDNKTFFDNRKSSIYKNCYDFSIFGIGDYSFIKYKVGLSGFYKKPLFSLIYSENKPVMLDDTSYFIGFDNYSDAYTTMLILNNDTVQEFLISISFQDAKRPFTKKLLSRLDFKKITNFLKITDLKRTEKKLKLKSFINEIAYENFKKKITIDELDLFSSI